MTQQARIDKGMYWDEALSLVSGCTPISPGCDHCWSAKETHMRANNPNEKVRTRNQGLTDKGCFNGKTRLNHEFLDKPLRRKKPTFYAVWNDLFHEDVPDEFIDEAFAVMLAAHIFTNIPGHTFLILTKRPERMKEYFSAGAEILLKRWANAGNGWIYVDDPDIFFSELVESAVCHDWDENGCNSSDSQYKPWGYLNKLWPLPNVWLGVTAENQEQADKRIPILLQTPAAVRFVSVEPMLGPVDLTELPIPYEVDCRGFNFTALTDSDDEHYYNSHAKIDWVICGGESGPGARPCHPDWIRSLRDQCNAAGVPFFLKQMHINGKLVKMPELDGKRWMEMPGVGT